MIELKTVSISDLTVESANWIAQLIKRNNMPRISSRYKEAENGTITGVEHYVTFREDSADSIIELFEEHRFSLEYENDEWHVTSADGKFTQSDEKLAQAALKTFIAISKDGKPVAVPTSLQVKDAN